MSAIIEKPRRSAFGAEQSSRDAGDESRGRILFIGPLPPPVTGQSLACAVFVEDLYKNYDVDVVDINKSDLSSGVVSWGRIGEIFKLILQIHRKVKSADAVYFTVAESLAGNIKDLIIYAVCGSRLNRMIIHLHGGAGMIKLLNGKFGVLRALNRWFIRRMAAVIVLGDRLRNVYAGVADASQVRVVPNFAQNEFFLSDAEIDEKYSRQGPLRIAFLSNMIPEKGYLLMLDAYTALPLECRSRIKLDFAGAFVSPEAESAFNAQISGLPAVHYHGLVHGPEKRNFLEDAHVLCLPTYYPYEGQPICILEAYAAGCAVITTDHSGILDVFSDGANGLLVEKKSATALADVFLRMLSDPAALRRYGELNAKTAREEFTTSRYNDDLNRIVQAAMSRPPL